MNIQTYQWGTEVNCGNEPCAKLSRVVLDPEQGTVSHLIVEQGLLMKKAWVIARRHVQEATADGLWLDLSEEELHESPPYKRRVIEEVAPGYAGTTNAPSPTSLAGPDVGDVPMVEQVVHDGVPSSDMVVLGKGVQLRDQVEEKNVGKLQQIVVDAESGEIVQLMATTGLRGEERTLQPSDILHYDEDRILLESAAQGVS